MEARRVSEGEGGDGPFTTLVSFFRVVLSPHGRGHAAVMMQAPQGGAGNVVCKGAPLGALEHRKLDSVTPSWESKTQCSEMVKAGGATLKLEWRGVGEAFVIGAPPHKSPTGKHDLPSVFAGAAEVVATLDGRRLPGKPILRDMAGRKITTAFLAFSETWIKG